jgi:hypothetical protein
MSLVIFETEKQAYNVYQKIIAYDDSWTIFGKTLQSSFILHVGDSKSDFFTIAVLGGNITNILDGVNGSPPIKQRMFRKKLLNFITVMYTSQNCAHYKIDDILFEVRHHNMELKKYKIPILMDKYELKD